jgi:predicted AlkP superfamily phosphohydrolase/phosphomutase
MRDTLRHRLVVLGLDGLPLDLALRLAELGLENLGALCRRPGTRSVASELPELSPVNWTSFFTAEGPEVHGIYGFSRIDPSDYSISFADFGQVGCPTVFDRIARTGRSSRVINLPNTYPARPIGGWLVSGFTAFDLARAVHPPFLLGPLRAAGYVLEADTLRAREDPRHLLDELGRTLEGRRRALELFWPDLGWDLFVLVLTETDRLFHFLYPAVEDVDHPLFGPCMELLRRWDRLIGEVLERYEALPQPKRLIVLADHGFTSLTTEIDLNAWLRSAGHLALQGSPASEWDGSVVSERSRAFALDPGRIYLHERGRFARGRLSAPECRRLAGELREGLLSLTFEGQKVMEAVHTREELYGNGCAPGAPDLVCVPRPGFDLKAKFDRREVFARFGRQGTHTAEGAFFHDSDGSTPCRIRDIGREVLRFFSTGEADPPGGRGIPSGDNRVVCAYPHRT